MAEQDQQLPDGRPRNAGVQINEDEIHTVQIRIPPFWKTNPQLWFTQTEAQFATAGIRSDISKYNNLVGKLDIDILNNVSDIVLNPPAQDKYQTLKNRL